MFKLNLLLRGYYLREQRYVLLGFLILPLLIWFLTVQFFNPIFLNQVSIGYSDESVVQEVDNAQWVKVSDSEKALKEGRVDMYVDRDRGLVIRTSQPQYAVYRMILGIPKVKSYLSERSLEYLTPYFDNQSATKKAYDESDPNFEFVVHYEWVNSEEGLQKVSQRTLFNGSYQMILVMIFAFFLVYQRKGMMGESLFKKQPLLMKKENQFKLYQSLIDIMLLMAYSLMASVILPTLGNVTSLIASVLLLYGLMVILASIISSTQGYAYAGSIVIIISLLLVSTFVPTGANLPMVNDLLESFRYGSISSRYVWWLVLIIGTWSMVKGARHVIRSKRSM